MLTRLFLIVIALIFIVVIFDIPILPATKWGFVDKQGTLIIPALFDRVNGVGEGNIAYTCRSQKSFHEGLAAIAIGKLWGFVDKNGKIVIKPQYDALGDFSEGLASVQTADKCGFIDHSGKMVIPAIFNPRWLYCGFMYFHDGLCAVEVTPNVMAYIDKTGNYIVKPELYFGWPFSEERAICQQLNAEHGALIDTKGKIVFEPKNARLIGNCSEGLIRVESDKDGNMTSKKYWYVDRNGKKMTEDLVGNGQDFSEGLAAANFGSDKYGYVNRKGEQVIKPAFVKVGDFHEGLAAVGIENPDKEKTLHYKWGYIDKSGAWVVEPKYNNAGPFSEGMAAVRIDEPTSSREGFIDKKGNLIIPTKYAHGFPFSEGLAAVKMAPSFSF